jgi:phosphoglucosamine mutase
MTAKKYFGTDGVRGRVGESPITPEMVMRLGYAAGKVLAETSRHTQDRPAVLIGKDTRISGYMLESALEAGLAAAGVDILLSGPMPTPAVAYLTRALRLQAGVVISASHNPYEDNGIKFFSSDGTKLPDAVEYAIEAELENPMKTMPSAKLGKARRLNDAVGRYIEFCKSTFPNELDLRGRRMVIDCAHGATYHIAPHVFHELGADVIAIGNQPDGLNINIECGSTYPSLLQHAVKEHKADLGIAFDGDGDRLIMTDNNGTVFDGDQLLYIIAIHRKNLGILKGGLVGTLMTNLAMEQALAKLDIPFARANVGDRYVLELLNKKAWQLGGENSGHILCLDKHTTGDGIISALQVLYALCDTDETLASITKNLDLYPQVMVNVNVNSGFAWQGHSAVVSIIAEANNKLAGAGRVLLRASGTEPLIRVMVEGKSSETVHYWANTIADVVREAACGETPIVKA